MGSAYCPCPAGPANTRRLCRAGDWDGYTTLFRSHREVSFASAGRTDPEHYIMFLDGLDVLPLPGRPCYYRRLSRRGHDHGRSKVSEVFMPFFAHGIQRIAKFMLLN